MIQAVARERRANNFACQTVHLKGTPDEIVFDIVEAKWFSRKRKNEFEYRGPIPFEINGDEAPSGVNPGKYYLSQPKKDVPCELQRGAQWFYSDMQIVESALAQRLNVVLFGLIGDAYNSNPRLCKPCSSLEVSNRILGLR